MKKNIDQINQEKLDKYRKEQLRSEQLKKGVADLNYELQKIQSFIQEKNKELNDFRSIFDAQHNLAERLNLIQRSIVMFSNQLNALKPKIYMVEEPAFPNLKTK